jgi:hypothetical protein
MRAYGLLLLAFAGLAAGCKSEQEQRMRDAERPRDYAAPPPSLSWEPFPSQTESDQRTRSR